MARHILINLLVVSVTATAVPASAQLIPPGSRVRVGARGDNPGWVTGRVIKATSREFILEADQALEPTMVVMSSSTRLQLMTGRTTRRLPGGVLGFLLGSVAGATVLNGLADNLYVDDASKALQGAVIFGVVGAVTGAFIGSSVGEDVWREVPLVAGRVAPPPLTTRNRPRGTASWARVERWTRFEPNIPNFEAFFDEHEPSLHPVEGIWMWGNNRPIAVVRDDRYPGFDHVAVWLENPRPSARDVRRLEGRLLAALRQVAGYVEVRFIDWTGILTGRVARAYPSDGDLVFGEAPLDGERWVKTHP